MQRALHGLDAKPGVASFGSWHPRDMLVARHPCRLISERLSVEMEAGQGFSIGM